MSDLDKLKTAIKKLLIENKKQSGPYWFGSEQMANNVLGFIEDLKRENNKPGSKCKRCGMPYKDSGEFYEEK